MPHDPLGETPYVEISARRKGAFAMAFGSESEHSHFCCLCGNHSQSVIGLLGTM